MPEEQLIQIGPFRLDLASEGVWCDGELQRLTPKAFSVLHHLVEHAGQLVTKEDLFSAVWPETVVGDAVLTKSIRELRQVLGDNPKTPQFIETVHRRGYRWVAPTEALELGDNSQLEGGEIDGGNGLAQHETNGFDPVPVQQEPSHLIPEVDSRDARRWLPTALIVIALLIIGAGVVIFRTSSPDMELATESTSTHADSALSLPDKPSIAVLPFTNMSGDPTQEYFSDGMTDDIITNLSQFSGLFVISRHSAFQYKNKDGVDISEVGRELGVRYVLEGSVQKAGSQVRITAQLIDSTTDHHVWAERYDRELSDVFALQDEVAQQIVTALRVEIQAAELDRIRHIPTSDLSAYDAVLRGMEYGFRATPKDNIQARRLFERAVALDPNYADAYAWLGWSYFMEWLLWNQDPKLMARVEELSKQALALDHTTLFGHMLSSNVYMSKKQFDQAVTAAEHLLTLDPNFADGYNHLALVLRMAGRPEEAIDAMRQAIRLNPHYPAVYAIELGTAYSLTGRYTEAIETFQDAIRRNPYHIIPHLRLASVYLNQWTGQWSEDPQNLVHALAAAQQGVALGDSSFWAHGTLSVVYLYQKKYTAALAAAERSLALNPNDALSHAYVGNVLNFMGRAQESVALMEQVSCDTAFMNSPPFCFSVLAHAYALTLRHDESISALKQALSHKPDVAMRLGIHLGLAGSYATLGQTRQARAEIAQIMKINPHYSLAGLKQTLPYQNTLYMYGVEASMRQAGLR